MWDSNLCSLTWCAALESYVHLSIDLYDCQRSWECTRVLKFVCRDVGASTCVYTHVRMCIWVKRWQRLCIVLDVDKESSGSKQKFCPHSIYSMSAGVGRGSLKCEDDRSLLSQRLWSDILMCLRLNHTPTHTQPPTSDIPTNPQTFQYLTSSYHTLRLGFDLLFTHIIFASSCGIPYVYSQLWKYLFF